jgi:hypothetical protein
MRRTQKLSAIPLMLAAYLLCIPSAMAQALGALPKIEGENLAGQTVELPEAAAGKVAVLIFGFSKASKGPTSAWAKKISADFPNQPAFVLYQLPVLEDVPRFIRGMVISGMRKDVPGNMHDHFVPLLHGEAQLKTLVSYKDSDDAYLVVLDRGGKIVAQTHDPFSETDYSQLREKIVSLLNAEGPH